MLQTSAERRSVLAEELGHYYTATGNIIRQGTVTNRKIERLGRFFAYNRLIGLSGIIEAHVAGCRNRYEVAEYLEVTEEFLEEALHAYKAKYGRQAMYKNYVVYFDPHLAVMKRI